TRRRREQRQESDSSRPRNSGEFSLHGGPCTLAAADFTPRAQAATRSRVKLETCNCVHNEPERENGPRSGPSFSSLVEAAGIEPDHFLGLPMPTEGFNCPLTTILTTSTVCLPLIKGRLRASAASRPAAALAPRATPVARHTQAAQSPARSTRRGVV